MKVVSLTWAANPAGFSPWLALGLGSREHGNELVRANSSARSDQNPFINGDVLESLAPINSTRPSDKAREPPKPGSLKRLAIAAVIWTAGEDRFGRPFETP